MKNTTAVGVPEETKISLISGDKRISRKNQVDSFTVFPTVPGKPVFEFQCQRSKNSVAGQNVPYPSGNLHEYLLPVVDGFKTFLLVGEQQRFLAAESEYPEHAKALVEEVHHPVLQVLIKIDEYVAAENQLKFIKGLIAGQVVRRKDNIIAETAVEDGGIVMGDV